jgi:L-lactate dehydrogenase complex protein LldF
MGYLQLETFLDKSAAKSLNDGFKGKLKHNIGQYDKSVVNGKLQFEQIELAKKLAKNVKWKAIENLDNTLLEFEANFTKRGGKVLWACDTAEAQKYILEICKKANADQIVKSKSMTTEEIHLNEFLEKNNIASIETDLGEYIQQLDGEAPFHIVTPAMHKSKEDCAKVFETKLGEAPGLTPQEMTAIARRNLRKKYAEAKVGITGANFLLADVGAISVTENEGNARLTTTFPNIHIAIAGIEKVLPSIHDLSLFLPLLSTFGTGQNLTVYNTIFTGAALPNEVDGPSEMYVILLDNGRSNLLAEAQQREALYCIRCGACLNACPVYKNIGGHTYDTTYSGPIGSVISPHYEGMEQFRHLSFASSLCGNCTEVCPMKINLHNMLLYNRRDSVEQKITTSGERFTWNIFKYMMLKRKRINRGSVGIKNKILSFMFKSAWGKNRTMISLAPKSFEQLWNEDAKKVK